jgi:hypothetical protein
MHGIGTGVVAGTPENFVTLNKPILRIPATSSDSTQAIDSDTNSRVVNVGLWKWRIYSFDPNPSSEFLKPVIQ